MISLPQVFGDKAKFYTDANALRGMFTPIVKPAVTREDGRTYRPNFTLKCAGLAKNVDHLECEERVNKDGSKETVVKRVVWKTDTNVREKTEEEKEKDRDIKWVLCTGQTTLPDGKVVDKITDKVVVKKADGSVLLDAAGKPVKRYVGPQDVKPGCVIKPMFSIKKVWYVQTFGVHLYLESARIYPPPPKKAIEFDDAVMEDDDDALVTSQVLHEIEKRAEEEPPVDVHAAAVSAEEAPEVPAATTAAAAAAPAPSEPITSPAKKRKADDGEPAKKKKTKTLEDE